MNDSALYNFFFNSRWQHVPRPAVVNEHKSIRQIIGLALNIHSLSLAHDVYLNGKMLLK
jgi:hypothetical protein